MVAIAVDTADVVDVDGAAIAAVVIFDNGFGNALVCLRALYSQVIFDAWYFGIQW